MGYALQSLLRIRLMREDRASGELTAARQAVARAQIRWQIIEMPVLNGARFGVQMQQARGVPALQRGLCDQLLRQIKRKIRSFQGVLPFFVIMR